MKKLLIFLAVCGALAIAAPALAADGIITGTITHAADSTAIAGMEMTAENISTETTSYAVAGPDGTYSFTLAPGTYDVANYAYSSVAAEPGIIFLKKTLTVTVGSGETKSGNNFALTRRGRFIGHVYASDGVTPISGAYMSIVNSESALSGQGGATTASDGSYLATPTNSDTSLSAVGTYTFNVTKTGYFGAQITGVALAADETTVTQNITLTSASTMSGFVHDANGTAIAGATVMLTKTTTTPLGPFGSSYTALTNAAGAYTVSIFDMSNYNGSAVGDYAVSVSKTGYITYGTDISIEADASALTGQNFTLATAGAITGTISSSAGAGLSGATVSATDGFGGTYSATTNASGSYTLSSLSPSSQYTLTVTKTNYVGQKAYNIKVAGGATTTKNFTLPLAKTFSGTILAKDNTVLVGATVYLYKLNKTRTEIADFSYTTKSNGNFVFKNVSPGSYRVKVVKSGYVSITIDSLAINSNVTGKIYKLEPASTITGRIIIGKNTGVSSVDIAVYAENNGKDVAYTSTSSDENGYYFISGLKKGTYRLKLTSANYVTQVVKYTLKTIAATINIKLAAAGSVTGYITDKETGLPVAGMVKVIGTAITAMSDANGYFFIGGIAPGDRKLTVISTYYDLPGQKQVKVEAGKIKLVNFSLAPRQ